MKVIETGKVTTTITLGDDNILSTTTTAKSRSLKILVWTETMMVGMTPIIKRLVITMASWIINIGTTVIGHTLEVATVLVIVVISTIIIAMIIDVICKKMREIVIVMRTRITQMETLETVIAVSIDKAEKVMVVARAWTTIVTNIQNWYSTIAVKVLTQIDDAVDRTRILTSTSLFGSIYLLSWRSFRDAASYCCGFFFLRSLLAFNVV